MEFKKIDDTTFEVTKTQDPIITTYDIGFLKEQEARIVKDLADYTDARNKELAEIKDLISGAEAAGIKSDSPFMSGIKNRAI